VGAVLSFAYNRPAPLVDANVSRVFARVFNDATPIDSPAGRKRHWAWAAQLVHPTEPRAYNSALMELGQTICTGGEPTCLLCPVRAFCKAESPAALPVKLPKKETLTAEHHDLWVLTERGLLMEKQADGKRHEGMYRLPQRSKEQVAALPLLTTQKYTVTRYKVTRHLYRGAADTAPQGAEEFIPLHLLPATPMASPDRKIIDKLI
jgi:A/G-specific adenine glycosylase